MKRFLLSIALLACSSLPIAAQAKGIPLVLNTGDELFAIKGAPAFDDGYAVGYACKRLGVFGADIWTWDCNIMAINEAEFSVGDLEPAAAAEMARKYPLSARERSLWNHYGFAAILLGVAGFGAVGLRRS